MQKQIFNCSQLDNLTEKKKTNTSNFLGVKRSPLKAHGQFFIVI